MFSTLPKTNFSFSVTFILSVNAFNWDQSKILSFGKELKGNCQLNNTFIYLSVCTCICASFHRSVRLPIHLSIRLSVCPSIHLSICLVCQSTHPPDHTSIYRSVCPSIHTSIHPSINLFIPFFTKGTSYPKQVRVNQNNTG